MASPALLLAFLPLSASPPEPVRGDHPEAPDGRRGIGVESDLADILRLFRQPDEEDEAFLRELARLEQDVMVLAQTAAGLYSQRGYFALLPPRGEGTLEHLHAAFQQHALDPRGVLAAVPDGDARARAFATMFLDVRFRTRMDLLADWRAIADEVRLGLAVLKATTDGWVRPSDDEARNVAIRVDVAAALLRARFKDLEALREAPLSVADVDSGELEALLARPYGETADELRRDLADVAEREALRAERMKELLFTPRMEADATDWLAWRRERTAAAAQAIDDVRLYRPDTEEGQAAPPEIKRLSKTRRRRMAYDRALEGLANDPLNAELAYAAGVLARFVGGTLEALSHYDRFLALHGIRAHDHHTYTYSELTPEEDDALFYVQDEAKKGFGPPPIVGAAPPAGP